MSFIYHKTGDCTGTLGAALCRSPGPFSLTGWADDLVILVDGYRRWDWLLKAVYRRLEEELAKLDVRINEEKTQRVDLTRDESFSFLGFDFRRMRTL